MSEAADRICTKPGGRAGHGRLHRWLAKHKIEIHYVTPVHAAVSRAAVEAALAGAPTESKALPAFQPNDFVPLGSVVLALFSTRTRYTRQATRRWLARNGVAVFRPAREVALVPKLQLEQALEKYGRPPVRKDVSGPAREASRRARLREFGSDGAWGRAMRAKRGAVPASERQTVIPGHMLCPTSSQSEGK